MSVYSSDPFVWEKEQASRAGPETAWFLEPDLLRICLWFYPPQFVCLHREILRHTAGTSQVLH